MLARVVDLEDSSVEIEVSVLSSDANVVLIWTSGVWLVLGVNLSEPCSHESLSIEVHDLWHGVTDNLVVKWDGDTSSELHI